jgi:hypothetical protein
VWQGVDKRVRVRFSMHRCEGGTEVYTSTHLATFCDHLDFVAYVVVFVDGRTHVTFSLLKFSCGVDLPAPDEASGRNEGAMRVEWVGEFG